MGREPIGTSKPKTETKPQQQQTSERFTHLKGSEMKPGQKWVGRYSGSYTDKMYGDERHLFKTAKGEVLVFREWAQLKEIFEAVTKGDVLEIEFLGKKDIGKGRKVMEFSAVKLTGKEAEAAAEAEAKEVDEDAMPF